MLSIGDEERETYRLFKKPIASIPEVYGRLSASLIRLREDFSALMNSLEEIRDKIAKDIRLKKVRPKKKPFGLELERLRITGVDGTNRDKELFGAYLGVIAAVAITAKGLQDKNPRILADGDVFALSSGGIPKRTIDIRRHIGEMRVAIESIKQFNPDLVMLDGPLIFHDALIPVRAFDSVEYWKAFARLVGLSNRFWRDSGLASEDLRIKPPSLF
ncbi:MAG: DNA double-strand break repair nuclease NurA, partial [Promethearchaeota archaeon]